MHIFFTVSLRQNGFGTGFIKIDAILPKGHVLLRNGVRFFPRPLLAPPSTRLAACLPIGSDTGLPL
jgi:hypothetical protein